MNRQYPESLVVNFKRVELLRKEAVNLVAIDLSTDQLCDLELLLNRGLYPLEGYMSQQCYNSVIDTMQMPCGTVFPMPVYLDISKQKSSVIAVGQRIALNDQEGFLIAIMTINDIWQADKEKEAQSIYGTNDPITHPGVRRLYDSVREIYVGGSLEGVSLPIHYDFQSLRLTPSESASLFSAKKWRKVIGFQVDDYLHCGHREIILHAARKIDAGIFVQPIVDLSHPGAQAHYTQVRCHQAFIKYLPSEIVQLGVMPLTCRKAGPKEALWQAIIKKNFGCSHFLVAADHADPFTPNNKKENTPLFYEQGAAQELVSEYAEKTGISMVPLRTLVYSETRKTYYFSSETDISSNDLQPVDSNNLIARLQKEKAVPNWLSYSEIVQELRHDFPPLKKQGFTIFMSGLSGSGKSTIAKVLQVKFMEMRDKPVTLLDGDIVRQNLSSELSFSEEHRNLNITRIGFVASEITKNGGIALCAPIAPYEESRQANRKLILRYGGYIEVYISTPLEICERRDRKGLYAKAHSGRIKDVTGITAPYIPPINPEITIDTTNISPMDAVQEILLYLKNAGYLKE
ncbi:MAG: bifunctional sulfate adenylyltransferase/adenylylsulfate kinase [Desulfotalea sp.]